jgi:hypothetical protein
VGKTLNIIACSPTDPDATDPINGTLDQIRDGFVKEGVPFVREATVRGVASRIEAANEGGDVELVQIIGHGGPGILSLGSVWAHTYKEPRPFGSAYVIDSNPYEYSMLEPFVGPKTRIALIGCWVGDDDGPRTQIPDGTTLLFDLARMLGSPVMAALCTVQPRDFVDGLFRGPMRVSDGTFVNGSTCPVPTTTPSATKVFFQRIERIPVLGPRARPLGMQLSPATASTLSNGYSRVIDFPNIAAFPEMEFTVTMSLGGPPLAAATIRRGRYLRVADGGTIRYFQAQQQGILGVQRTLGDLIRFGNQPI